MTGFTPTGTVATTVPKPIASTGLVRSQFGLPTRAVAEQSGMLMTLSDPGLTPSPAFATSNSLRTGAKSAQSGLTVAGLVHAGAMQSAIGFVVPGGVVGTISSALVCALITETVPSPWFRMNARLASPLMTP